MEQAGTIPAVGASSSIERWRLKVLTYMIRKELNSFYLIIIYITLMTNITFYKKMEKIFQLLLTEGR
ncbi:hypothetical protein DD577_29650 [Klebsiella pneumoniae]|nr:hypothetical protein DD577_29650 [Klebsiella pneumoniae]